MSPKLVAGRVCSQFVETAARVNSVGNWELRAVIAAYGLCCLGPGLRFSQRRNRFSISSNNSCSSPKRPAVLFQQTTHVGAANRCGTVLSRLFLVRSQITSVR